MKLTRQLYWLVFATCTDNGGRISADTLFQLAAELVGAAGAAHLIAEMDADALDALLNLHY